MGIANLVRAGAVALLVLLLAGGLAIGGVRMGATVQALAALAFAGAWLAVALAFHRLHRAVAHAPVAVEAEAFEAPAAPVPSRELAEQQAVTAALAARLVALREGDLTKVITEAFPEAHEPLRANFNESVDALRRMVLRVNMSATTIDQGAREITAAADDLARRTEASAANLAETNVALHQAEARVRESVGATTETMTRADQAKHAVSEGRATGEDAAASMDRVAASAENIGSVIDGLDKIAFQTRVLAMNAAVEAGRAGEAGRGFAVVADLVSALALRAEEEAKRVRNLVGTTRNDISTAVSAVHRMDDKLAAIADDVDALYQLLVRIQGDSSDQSRTMGEIAMTMAALDSSTQQNAAMVQETSSAARNLVTEVATLLEHAVAFKFDRRKRDVAVAVDRRGGDDVEWRMDNRYALPMPAVSKTTTGASVH